jgi:hypothetical protein
MTKSRLGLFSCFERMPVPFYVLLHSLLFLLFYYFILYKRWQAVKVTPEPSFFAGVIDADKVSKHL